MDNVTCENCGTVNPVGVKFCKQCGTLLPATAAYVPPAAAPGPSAAQYGKSPAPMEKRYGVLRGIANLCKALAIVFAVLNILWGVGSLFVIGFAQGDPLLGFAALIGSLISAALTYLLWRLIGESISVQLDIEENTRRIAHLLERQMG